MAGAAVAQNLQPPRTEPVMAPVPGKITARNVDAAFNPDWAAYRAGNPEATPYLGVGPVPSQQSSVSIIRLPCTPAYQVMVPECSGGAALSLFSVFFSDGGQVEAPVDCPVKTNPESCDALWREKGASVIAAAKATK